MPVVFGVLFGIIAAIIVATFRKGESVQANNKEEASADEAIISTVGSSELDQVFAIVGARRGVDPDLLKAIAMQESQLDANAVRWNPPKDVSAGLMQILAVPPVGVPQGQNFTPTNRFDIEGWPVTFLELLDPETNVDFGAQILAYNLRTYGFPRGVAVYNNFSARFASQDGPFPNDAYVRRVLSNLHKLKGQA